MKTTVKSLRIANPLLELLERAKAVSTFRGLPTAGILRDNCAEGMAEFVRRNDGWQWRCDDCGKPVSVRNGIVEWWEDDNHRRSLRFVHGRGYRCSLLEKEQPPRIKGVRYREFLSRLVGENSMNMLLDIRSGERSWEDGGRGADQLIRRLTILGYEQAFRWESVARAEGLIAPQSNGFLWREEIWKILRRLDGEVNANFDSNAAKGPEIKTSFDQMTGNELIHARDAAQFALRLMGEEPTHHDD